MKSLRGRILFILLGGMALVVLTNALLMQYYVTDQFDQLQQAEALRNLDRAVRAIDSKQEHLKQLCADWSAWEEVYDGMGDDRLAFIARNIFPRTFEINNLCVLAFYREDGTVVWGGVLVAGERRIADLATVNLPPVLARIHPLLSDRSKIDRDVGLLQTDVGLLMVAARHVVHANGKGPTRGTLVMGRLLGEAMLEDIIEQVHVPVQVIPLDESSGSAGIEPQVSMFDHQTLLSERILYDIQSQPVAALRVFTPCDISQKGQATATYVFVLACALVVLACGLIFVTLGAFVIRPMRRLRKGMQLASEGGPVDLSGLVDRKDELGDVAREFDLLLNRLERRNAEKQAILERHEKMVAHMPVGLCRSHAGIEGRVVFGNPALARLLGYETARDLQGLSVRAIYADAEAYQVLVTRIDAGQSVVDHQIKLRRQNGTEFWGSISAQLINETRGEAYIDVAVIDVTQHIESAARVQQTMRELKRFNEIAVGREMQMIKLKQEVNDLSTRLGLARPYHVPDGTKAGPMTSQR